MARSEARLQFGMWRAGLDGLSAHAKLVYAVLLTEPTMNHCGVGVPRIARWAKDASLTIAETEKALDELGESRHVLVDVDTDEVLVRTLIRNDRVAEQPYVLKAALKEALRTASPLLRYVLAEELRKLPPRQANSMSKTGRTVVYPDPHAAADELAPPGSRPPPDRPSPNPSETLFDQPSGKGFETLSEGSRRATSEKGSRTLHGGGGGDGGGTSSPVGGPVETTAANRSPKRADEPEPANKIAQALARGYHDLEPLSSFVAVMKIAKQALAAGYDRGRIEAALARLAESKRSVTANSLRIELDGPPLQTARSPHEQFGNAGAWQALKHTGTDTNVRAITGGDLHVDP